MLNQNNIVLNVSSIQKFNILTAQAPIVVMGGGDMTKNKPWQGQPWQTCWYTRVPDCILMYL